MAFNMRRRVRVHLVEGPSIEGYLVTARSGHYILEMPAVMLQEVGAAERLRDASAVEIPRSNVVFLEVLR